MIHVTQNKKNNYPLTDITLMRQSNERQKQSKSFVHIFLKDENNKSETETFYRR